MNNDNLIPNSARTPEELREMTRKGGIASGVARRKKRDARQSITLLLGMKAQGKIEDGLKSLGFDKSEITNMNALTAKVFMMAMNGNLKAYEKLMEYGGFTPNEKRQRKKTKAEIALIEANTARISGCRETTKTEGANREDAEQTYTDYAVSPAPVDLSDLTGEELDELERICSKIERRNSGSIDG